MCFLQRKLPVLTGGSQLGDVLGRELLVGGDPVLGTHVQPRLPRA